MKSGVKTRNELIAIILIKWEARKTLKKNTQEKNIRRDKGLFF